MRKFNLFLAMVLSSGTITGCATNGSSTNQGTEGNVTEILQNQSARTAISMAVDKEKMCDLILNNGSTPMDHYTGLGLCINKDEKEYQEVTGVKGYSYNKEGATKKWEEAKAELGFDTVTLELLTYDDDSSEKITQFLQAELQDNLPGLTVKIQKQPFKQKLQMENKGDFDISYTRWGADYQDPLSFLETFQPTGTFYKKAGYRSEEYNKLVEEAKNIQDQNESWKKYAEAEQMVLDSAFLSPLYQRGDAYVQKEYVKNLFSFPAVFETYKWVEINKDVKELSLTALADIPSIDVSKAGNSESFRTLGNTMEGLTRIDKDNNVVPGMAESWECSEDGKIWTFKIRENAKWSNGDKLTAKDFEYSWKRTLEPETAAGYASIMYDFVGGEEYNKSEATDSSSIGIKATDDYTLEVKLKRPITYFERLLAFPTFYPQNQKVVEAQGDKYGTTHDSIVYNGPFVLSDWRFEDQYSMTKNPNYWDAESVKIDKVNTKIVKDNNVALNLYETGSIDKCLINAESIDKYKDSKEFNSQSTEYSYIILINGGNHNK